MKPSFGIFSIEKFTKEQEKEFAAFIDKRARPILIFVYLFGGLIPLLFLLSDYFNFPEQFEQLAQVRASYLVFWVVLTTLTFSQWRLLSLNHSLLIYTTVGMVLITYNNVILIDRQMMLVPSALFFLFGIVISQTGARVALQSTAIAFIVPIVIIGIYDDFGKAERAMLTVLSTWAIAIWLASSILEKVNRRLFKYERAIHEAGKIKAAMLEQEAKANRFKSEFLANMSHEIRTPLTAIMGYAESYFDKDLSRETKDSAVNTIHSNGEHLLTLVNDILDLSKIEAGMLEVEIIDSELFVLVEQVASIQRVVANAKGLEFEVRYQFPLPNKLQTDPTRLRQILLNLLSNAVKFTEQGKIILSVGYLVEPELLIVEIEDTGIGMDKATSDGLFQAYAQADASYRRVYGGTGLGLYISKQLVEKLGGSISVDSEPNRGSCFAFQIYAPLTEMTHMLDQAPDTTMKTGPQGSKVKLNGHVLLADDHDDNRRLIGFRLKQLGLSVDQVENGEQAVERALLGEYDLILMDIQMPIMNGEAATEMIRHTDQETPIIALTANAMQQDIEQYLANGFNAHLSKPLVQDDFVKLLSEYCQTDEQVEEEDDSLFSINNQEYRRMVDDYVSSLPCELELLKFSRSSKDWQKMSRIAHGLKGAAGNFGFNQITEYAAKVERIIHEEKFAEVELAYAELCGEINRVLMQQAR